MRDFPPAAAAGNVDSSAHHAPDGKTDDSAMSVLAKAAHIARSGVASAVRPLENAGSASRSRIDRPGRSAARQSFGPTITGAAGGARRTSDHVGGAMLPPPVNTVALSDGTRISFGAVAEADAYEDA
jgi:hypothetical protein